MSEDSLNHQDLVRHLGMTAQEEVYFLKSFMQLDEHLKTFNFTAFQDGVNQLKRDLDAYRKSRHKVPGVFRMGDGRTFLWSLGVPLPTPCPETGEPMSGAAFQKKAPRPETKEEAFRKAYVGSVGNAAEFTWSPGYVYPDKSTPPPSWVGVDPGVESQQKAAQKLGDILKEMFDNAAIHGTPAAEDDEAAGPESAGRARKRSKRDLDEKRRNLWKNKK